MLGPYEKSTPSFKVEIKLLLQRYKMTCLGDVRVGLISMTKEVRDLFINQEVWFILSLCVQHLVVEHEDALVLFEN